METEGKLNYIEKVLSTHHSRVFRIRTRADMKAFLALNSRIKLLFLYMPGCGPCKATAPEIAKLFARNNDIAIGCLSSEHYAWLMEPTCPLKFKTGVPQGFPHMELYVGSSPVGEMTERSAYRMQRELETNFPSLKGKIAVLSDSELRSGGAMYLGKTKTAGATTTAPLSAQSQNFLAQKMQRIQAQYELYRQKKMQQTTTTTKTESKKMGGGASQAQPPSNNTTSHHRNITLVSQFF